MAISGELSPTSPVILQDEIDGAHAVYGHQVPAGATPINSPFLSLLDTIDAANGFFALAYEENGVVFVSFEGTDTAPTIYGLGSVAADLQIIQGQTPTALTDAILFTQGVESLVGSTPIYLTGHSLGGVEAEAVSLFAASPGNNLSIAGGVTFGALGLPGYFGPTGLGNLTDFVDYGDPAGNYAHDGELAPVSATGNHFGTVDYVGPPADANAMVGDLLSGNVAAALQFHDLSHYAADLGLTLDPPSLVAGVLPTSSSFGLMNAQTTTGPQDSGGKPPHVSPGLDHVVTLFNQFVAAGFPDQHGALSTNPLSQTAMNQEQFLAQPHHG
jgi:hypothetical protein